VFIYLTILDRPSANAGLSVVHVLGDEAKYLKTRKLKSVRQYYQESGLESLLTGLTKPENVRLLFVNDHFEGKRNAVSGLFRPTLNRLFPAL
jgi:hypothetical protein